MEYSAVTLRLLAYDIWESGRLKAKSPNESIRKGRLAFLVPNRASLSSLLLNVCCDKETSNCVKLQEIRVTVS